MVGEGAACGPLANIGIDGGPAGRRRAQRLGFAGVRLGLFEAYLELVDESGRPLGAMAVERAAHLRVLELDQRVAGLQIGDDRVCASELGIDLSGVRAGLVSLLAERPNVRR